jgi:hypothetical protein
MLSGSLAAKGRRAPYLLARASCASQHRRTALAACRTYFRLSEGLPEVIIADRQSVDDSSRCLPTAPDNRIVIPHGQM